MKKSIVVSTQLTKFSALAFKEDFEESIKKVTDLGFEAQNWQSGVPKIYK